MGKKAIIGGSLAGLAAVGASFAAGRETAPEAGVQQTNIEVVIADYNLGCAETVLEAAGVKFVVIANDPNTATDELYQSRKAAETDSQEFIEDEMKACMEQKLPDGLTGYEVQMPVFTPNAPVTTSTEG